MCLLFKCNGQFNPTCELGERFTGCTLSPAGGADTQRGNTNTRVGSDKEHPGIFLVCDPDHLGVFVYLEMLMSI